MTLRTRFAVFAIALASIVIFGIPPATAAPICVQHIDANGNDATTDFSARRKRHAARHYKHKRGHRYARRGGGKCDGFQRCRCGTTAARKHGIPYAYHASNGKTYNLKQAIEWRRAFPRTSFQINAVAVWPHHVATITGGSNCASATVYDDAGTYQRNVCGATIHSVSGASYAAASESYSAKPYSHDRRHHRRYARR